MKTKEMCVGNIGNYYGGLCIKKEGQKYFWSITNYDGDDWEEIPESLYVSLHEYEKKRVVNSKIADS